LNYEDLQNVIVNSIKENHAWNRAISLDIETSLDVLDGSKTPLLSISVARRNDDKIEIEKFVLEKETPEDETRLFDEFGNFCQKVRPLIMIGYGIGRFDLPVLLMKMRQLDNLFKQQGRYNSGYWAFRDTLTRSYILDMINPVRFEIANFDNVSPKMISLENAISHKRFVRLPFKNTKSIVSSMTSSGMDKWNAIHSLWENNKESFHRYIEGDVHDTLLLAEELFNVKQQ
jgi:DNA polymerase elongation subunit (family B)